MTPAGIEPATYRFVAEHLNHCATAVPNQTVLLEIKVKLMDAMTVSSCGL